MQFFKNVFLVLAGKRSFVGYAVANSDLPPIKKGILTSTSLPASRNNLPVESMISSDEWYATGYSISVDLQKIGRGYKYLGE